MKDVHFALLALSKLENIMYFNIIIIFAYNMIMK